MQTIGIRATLTALALLAVGGLPLAAYGDSASDSLNDFWQQTYGGGVSAPPGGVVGGPAIVTPIDPNPLVDSPAYPWSLLAKAEPDECFADPGNPYPPMTNGSCPGRSLPKVNQSYVFGMANTPSHIWFGTAPNMLCMAVGGDLISQIPSPPFPSIPLLPIIARVPPLSPAFVCEFGVGQYYLNNAQKPPHFPGVGDHRPPQIFRYNKAAETLEDRSPDPASADPEEQNAAALLANTYGLRAAGTLNNVVLLAGPEVGNEAVIVYAYRVDNGALIGARRYDEWGNVRSMEVANGFLESQRWHQRQRRRLGID